jgi:hypothetical protein
MVMGVNGGGPGRECRASRTSTVPAARFRTVQLLSHSRGLLAVIYAVPRHKRVDLVGCDLANDDEYYIADLRSNAVVAAARRL